MYVTIYTDADDVVSIYEFFIHLLIYIYLHSYALHTCIIIVIPQDMCIQDMWNN